MASFDNIGRLLAHKPAQIKGDRKLFTEFVQAYEAAGFRKETCMGCSFSSAYRKLKQFYHNNVKPEKMATEKTQNTEKKKVNTFIFSRHAPKTIYIPMHGRLLTTDSPDSDAVLYLTMNGGRHFEARSKFFDKLPDALENKSGKSEAKPTKSEDKPKKKGKGKKKKKAKAEKQTASQENEEIEEQVAAQVAQNAADNLKAGADFEDDEEDDDLFGGEDGEPTEDKEEPDYANMTKAQKREIDWSDKGYKVLKTAFPKLKGRSKAQILEQIPEFLAED